MSATDGAKQLEVWSDGCDKMSAPGERAQGPCAGPLAGLFNATTSGREAFFAKLRVAAGKVRRIEKRGYNAHFEYEYVTEADVKAAVGAALLEAGLSIGRVDVNVLQQENYTNAKGKPQQRVTVMVSISVTDGVDAAYFTGVGSGVDGEDKAPYKAMAGALKYALTMGFLIATGDDPEASGAAKPPVDTSTFEGLLESMPELLRRGELAELKLAVQQFRNHPQFAALKEAYAAATSAAGE